MASKHTKWIEHQQITSKAQRIEARPDSDGSTWDQTASHWLVTLRRVGRGPCAPLVVFYSQGSAHTRAPITEDVLGSLLMEAIGAEGSFEDWCANTGYDADSRRAESIFHACRDISKRLRAFLGDDYANACNAFSDY